MATIKKPTKVNMLGNAAVNKTVNKTVNKARQEVAAMSTNMRGKAYTQNRTKNTLAGYKAATGQTATSVPAIKKTTKKSALSKKTGIKPVIR